MTTLPVASGAGARELRDAGGVLLISCYELGHQPFAIASASAALAAAGFAAACADASIEAPTDDAVTRARVVAISVPMHTALRLGVALARRVRALNERAHICLFGLYATLNARFLLEGIADSVIGGEFEVALVQLAEKLDRNEAVASEAPPVLHRLTFHTPERSGLPALDRYARLLGPGAGEERLVGYVEASRGCLHRCRHCPITPVYEGRFFIVPQHIVLADAAQQVARGARHMTFGDPDFLNGPKHALAVATLLHAAHPEVTFDVTVKVEHILEHRHVFVELARLGCIFVVSAIESLSPRVLDELAKGHSKEDIVEALRITREAGIALRPSLVAFTPWTTLEDYVEQCDFIFEHGLVEHVDPIQLAIRLLLPPRSAVLSQPRERPWLDELDPAAFGYAWHHPDPRMDRLHADVTVIVDRASSAHAPAVETFRRIRETAYHALGRTPPADAEPTAGPFVPRLTEPWFCCAEPSRAQLCHSGRSPTSEV